MLHHLLWAVLAGNAVLTAAAAATGLVATCGGTSLPSLYDIDIETVLNGLNNGDFTSVDLTKAYVARITEVNDQLRAVTEINPDALAIASHLDRERASGHVRGPLHGVPILLKDTIATNDKMNNTAGSYALLGAKVPSDSTVARKLRDAGAIILGKTNLSEWGNFRMTLSTSNGWSAYGGQTLGPFYPHQDPSGSSSGSAVAAALGLATACIGGETSGSIIDPASNNNVVGVKPTVGMVSRHLVIPISEHMDTIGPLATTVKDAAYILQSIAGPDAHDNYTSAIPADADLDFVGACQAGALRGKRVGVPRNAIALKSDNSTWSMVAAFNASLNVLRSAGATVVEDTDFPLAREHMDNNPLSAQIMGADFVVGIERYLAQLTHNPHNITTLEQLRRWTRDSPREGYPERATDLWDMALEGWNNTENGFWQAYQRVLRYADEGGLLGTIRRHDLDAVVMPSHMAWAWAAMAGAPVVSVPLGAMPAGQAVVAGADGLITAAPNIPFGFGFLGAKFTDAKLLGMAFDLEQRTLARWKANPIVLPQTELDDVMEG
ncbi:amidase [Microdochium bolleyi]|uniref:Amidase n=1 Tax=Microdochium bolleyi TaxID=196109 RepID=A0A136INU9_9PEZI|nr:amidase [Microdochium bolleyi]